MRYSAAVLRESGMLSPRGEGGMNELELTGRAGTEGRFACDRCAEEFAHAINGSWRMHYLWNEAEAAHLDPSEVQIVSSTLAVIA